ncbi:MAG TPA: choice-of-anchor D domain-containing protein [Candidatus Acidoferrales bacterium]|nr:choice-of-anchor D domain-containing protein [Candidatus Acidoferrales bacterium]
MDPRANVYLTNADAPDRIFTLTGLANLPVNAASNPTVTASLALVAGNGVAGSLGDGGSALNSQFDMKLDSTVLRSGIAVASDGTIFVADTLNSTIRRVAASDSSEPGIVRSVAGRWAPRQEVTLSEPLGLALDRAGNLYIADHSGAIDVLPAATGSSSDARLIVLARVVAASSIALTVDGAYAFVSSPDTGAVFEINTQTRAIRAVAGFPARSNSSQEPRCAQQGSGSLATTGVCPAALAVDGKENLFVADANSGRILRVDAKSSQITVAASGLNLPGDMSFDVSGNLYVAEQGAERLLKFTDMGQPASNLTLMPSSFDFPNQPTGGATVTQAFTLMNNTTAAVSGLTISFNPSTDFQAPSNNCGTSLAAGAPPCTINVDFAPSAAGARTATLSVTDSDGDFATANLSGTGDDYEIALNGSSMEQSVFQGGMVTFNFNVMPDSVFAGTVTIICPASSQMPALTTCTANPSTVTVTPGTPAPFSVTFATTFDGILAGTTTSGALLATIPGGRASPPSDRVLVGWVFLGVCVFLTGPIFWRGLSNRSATVRPRSEHLAWASAALLLACATVFLGGCHHSSIPEGLSTPVGTTNLTIRGAAQNAGRGNTIILDVVAH